VRRRPGDLQGRLEALSEAVALARGRLHESDVGAAEAVVARAHRRLGVAPEATVAALAGATGSGKSSLFNALAERELADVGVRRPTTGRVHACVWGATDAPGLLDWLGAGRRDYVDGAAGLDGLVLLDLPDHDSTDETHRLEVDRLVELVDLFLWVTDPQKYADALLHERYLRPLRDHAAVTVVVLNHSDELDPDGRAACLVDLRRLLEEDGLENVPVVATSARTGEGLGALRSLLARRVEARRAATERLAADVTAVARALGRHCSPRRALRALDARDRVLLVAALADAAGVDAVVDAVRRAHRHRAGLRTGWPPTRWLRRLRPDPLRRLHLGGGDQGASSLPPAGPVQRARAASALRGIADAAGAHLDGPWPRLVRATTERAEADLPARLDRAVAEAAPDPGESPRWWGATALAQWLLLGAASAGAAWLGGLFVLAYLRLPDPPTPEVGEVPVPTGLLLGGLLCGLLLAVVARVAASVGARRRAVRARRRLHERIAAVADDEVLGPVAAELEAHDRLCDALGRAA